MKKKLTSNLVLKIVSVVVAFLFWLVIINITEVDKDIINNKGNLLNK